MDDGHGRYGDIKRDADLGQDDADMPACGIVEAGNRDVCVVQEFAAPNQAQTAEADENYRTQAVDVQQSVGGRRGLSFWSKDQQTYDQAGPEQDPADETATGPVLAKEQDVESEQLHQRDQESPRLPDNYAVVRRVNHA
jgi:hypothetical protein